MDVVEHRVELPPRPDSASEARRFVAQALHATDPGSREIGVLLASELVTNAVLYAQGSIVVRVIAREQTIRVSVHDEIPHEVAPRQVSVDATSGRGLALVERLSAAWGVDLAHDGNGKDVWFELPRRDAAGG